MGILKVDTVQDQDGNDIIQESAGTVTVGQSGQTVAVAGGATLSVPTLLVNGESVTAITLPTVTSLSPDTIENTQTSVTITGTNFVNGAVVNAISTTGAIFTADTVTFNSATSITAQFTLATDGNYYIRVENPDGLAGRSSTALLSVSDAPTWSTAAGSLGTMDDQTAGSFTVTATSDSAITYSKVSGDFPGGLTLNSSTGEISGTESGATADTTYNFTIRATDAEGQTADRAFSITVEVLYVIDNSLRFDDGSSDYLTRTTSGTITTFTFSLWVKRSSLKPSGRQNLIGLGPGSGNIGFFEFNNDRLAIVFDGTGTYWPKTDAVFRDSSAWYHVVASVDTTQATASDRCKFYVNGVQYTDTTGTFPPLNHSITISPIGISDYTGAIGNESFDGYMSEVCFIDGTALDPTSFGEFDADTNIWIPKPVSGLTFGTDGFYLPFENSAALGQDDSGNGNDFTVNNLTSVDQSTDTPTNNFATYNPLLPVTVTFSDGNLTGVTSSNWECSASTIPVTKGKWYCEINAVSLPTDNSLIGVEDVDLINVWQNSYVGVSANGWGYWSNGGQKYNNNTSSAYGSDYGQGDIIGIALDMDNKYVYFSKNGVFQNSGNPTSGATGTGGLALSGTEYVFVASAFTGTLSANFGSPPYTISSGNSDGNGYGNFEYSVPSGYYALNTTNLAEFG
jgi:hypothetical protein